MMAKLLIFLAILTTIANCGQLKLKPHRQGQRSEAVQTPTPATPAVPVAPAQSIPLATPSNDQAPAALAENPCSSGTPAGPEFSRDWTYISQYKGCQDPKTELIFLKPFRVILDPNLHFVFADNTIHWTAENASPVEQKISEICLNAGYYSFKDARVTNDFGDPAKKSLFYTKLVQSLTGSYDLEKAEARTWAILTQTITPNFAMQLTIPQGSSFYIGLNDDVVSGGDGLRILMPMTREMPLDGARNMWTSCVRAPDNF